MKLRERILGLLSAQHYRPVNESTLAKLLDLPKREHKSLSHQVRLLLSSRQLNRVQGDRLSLPLPTGKSGRPDSDLTRGRIMFRQGGSAYFLPEVADGQPAADSIQIAPDDTGVALHGDRVAIQVSPRRTPRRDGKGLESHGRVERIIERDNTTVVGHLQQIRKTWFVAPDDPRFFHEVRVADPAANRKLSPTPVAGDKVVVKLAEWTSRQKPIEGEIIERLGRTFEPSAELLGIYRKFDLATSFPVEVEREVSNIPAQVQPRELLGRLDYREIPTLTIDPDDAKDFDDALSLELLQNGNTRVGVHIADVSAYVKTGTHLDREAQRRGNSTYLVGTVIPMLPEKLSNGLCSLVEAQDRLCKATLLTFDKKQRLIETTYANTVIRSRKRLTYKQAFAFLFENDLEIIRALPLPPKHQTGSTGRALRDLTDTELIDIQQMIRRFWAIAKKLRSDRMAHGSLDLDMPETKIFVDEKGYADRLERIEHDESHQLIEEFMLAANEALARLTKNQRIPSIYRVHDEPDEDRLSDFRQQLAIVGIETGDLTLRSEIIKLLEQLKTHPQGYTLRTQLLRSLKKAAYRSTPDGHYGLHKNDYTHFTSPIRRYSDLLVHRVLDYHLIKNEGAPAPANYAFEYTAGRMESMGAHLSLTEVNSAEAERESVKIKLLEFFERELAKEIKTRFAAVITDTRQNGFFIELTESMTFGFVPASGMTDDYYQLNPAGNALVGKKTKRTFTLATHIEVVVYKVDRFKRLIDFAPAPVAVATKPAGTKKSKPEKSTDTRPIFKPTKKLK